MKAFHTTKKVTKTEVIPFDAKQLEELINQEKPSIIYHGQWNEQTPFLVITEYNKKGFKMYCNGWAEKEPQQYDAKKLHSFLKYQGLSDCYIK